MSRRGKRTTGADFTGAIWINVGADLGTQINEYMASQGYTDASTVIRELCAIALSTNPAEAVDQNARKKAYDDIRTWMIKEVYTFLNQLGARLKAEIEHG